ncbi:MAG: TerC family protein [Alphaproteobacteria bacterium]|nr:TerC family protein [Alphaproteobacteria bacterium]
MDITDPQIWASLLTLTALEIVLGIDNIIFISIVVARLPRETQARARYIGLAGALGFRVLLLASLVWIIGLTEPIAVFWNFEISWRDIILFCGGLFLLYKGTWEIHDTMEGHDDDAGAAGKTLSFHAAILQIMVLDIIFSMDSIVTAVGLTQFLPVMITAIVIAVIIMMVASGPVSDFIQKHPTTKMLALSFLLLIGAALVADGLHFHIPRGFLYFAIAFSITVEVLNLAASKRRRRKRA